MSTPDKYDPAKQFAAGVPVTRAVAKAEGLPLFLGNSCPKGHSGWRHILTRRCYECGDTLPIESPAHAVLLALRDGVWVDVARGAPVPMPGKATSREVAELFGFLVYWDGECWTPV